MFLPVSRHTQSESAPGGPSVKKPKDLQRNFSVSEMTTTPSPASQGTSMRVEEASWTLALWRGNRKEPRNQETKRN